MQKQLHAVDKATLKCNNFGQLKTPIRQLLFDDECPRAASCICEKQVCRSNTTDRQRRAAMQHLAVAFPPELYIVVTSVTFIQESN